MAIAFSPTPYGTILNTTVAVLNAVPITMACWFKPDTGALAAYCTLMCLGWYGSGTSLTLFALMNDGSSAGDPVQAWCQNVGTGGKANTTNPFQENVWQHACGVFAANNDRRVYLDGGSKGTNTSSATPDPTKIVCTSISSLHYSVAPALLFYGSIAEAAIWNIALTDDEVAMLAKGYSPLFIHPQNLKSYWPLIRRGTVIHNPDLRGVCHLTDEAAGIADSPHCRIIRPAPRGFPARHHYLTKYLHNGLFNVRPQDVTTCELVQPTPMMTGLGAIRPPDVTTGIINQPSVKMSFGVIDQKTQLTCAPILGGVN